MQHMQCFGMVKSEKKITTWFLCFSGGGGGGGGGVCVYVVGWGAGTSSLILMIQISNMFGPHQGPSPHQ